VTVPRTIPTFAVDARRALLGAAVVALALATAIDVAATTNRLHARVAALGRSRPVAVLRRDLPAGARLERDDLRTAMRHEAPLGAMPVGRARGRRLGVPLLRGAVVTARALRAAAVVVPEGTRAIRLRSEDARRLQAGDRVDVLVTLDPDRTGGGEPTRTVVERVAVLDVVPPRVGGPAAVLAVPAAYVPRAAYAASSGTITLARVPDRP
jgi:Flp pilus assembly protein CpaB